MLEYTPLWCNVKLAMIVLTSRSGIAAMVVNHRGNVHPFEVGDEAEAGRMPIEPGLDLRAVVKPSTAILRSLAIDRAACTVSPSVMREQSPAMRTRFEISADK